MSVATEVLDDVQLGEEIALRLIDIILDVIGPTKAKALLDEKFVAAVDAAADVAEDAKFPK